MLPKFNDLSKIHLPPEQWIYKKYLNLKEDLDGRTIRIYSIFNTESTPSMYLYIKNEKYRWKDHSSGQGGDAVDLVRAIMNREKSLLGQEEISLAVAIVEIRQSYEAWRILNEKFIPVPLEVEHYAYKLVSQYDAKEEALDYEDIRWWGLFGISQPLLDRYNVISLERYRLGKLCDGGVVWYSWNSHKYSYGFFSRDCELLKIYNPENIDFKHINLSKTIIGRDQLNHLRNRTLIICSSMKDMLVLKSMDLSVDVIAPMGEKALISAEDISCLKSMYDNIFTLFDNDKAGLQAMILYKSVYNIDFIYVPFHKDLAEFRLKEGHDKVKMELVNRIDKKLSKYTKKDEEFEKKQIEGETGEWTRDGWASF